MEGDLGGGRDPEPAPAERWHHAALYGAALLLILGGTGVLAFLVRAVRMREPDAAASAGGLFLLLALSGAGAGVAHHATRRLRERGAAGYYASWTATVYAFFAVVALLIYLATLLFSSRRSGDAAEFFSQPATLAVLAAVGLVVGLAVGRASREPPPGGSRPGRVSRGRIALAGGVLLVAVVVWFSARSDPSASAGGSLAELREAARADPADADAQKEFARALMSLEHWGEAIPPLERAVRLQPRDVELLTSLGWAYTRTGRHDEAIPVLTRARAIDPDNLEVLQDLGYALSQAGRLTEAERLFREALREHPETPWTHGALGWVLIGLGRFPEAETEFREAIRRFPDNADYHRGLAAALTHRGAAAAALRPLRRAVRLAPDDAELWGELGRAAHHARRYTESSRAYARADSIDPGYFAAHEEDLKTWAASLQRKPYR